MTYTEGVKILGVSRAQKWTLPGDTWTVFMYAKGATDLYPELWTAVRKTCTQVSLPSSQTTYCVYAMGWRELYSHNDIGKVLNVAVLQNMYPSQMLRVGHSLFALRAVGSPQLRPQWPKATVGIVLGGEWSATFSSALPWSCAADSSNATVTNAFALGMWAQLSSKSTISYRFSKLTTFFQRKAKGRRGIVNVSSWDQKIPMEFHRTKKKHFYRFEILSLTNFIGQLQTFSHQSFPTTTTKLKNNHNIFQHRKY